jgi:ribosomal protein L11 methyltransferase
MPWLQLRFQTMSDQTKLISELLESFGAIAISLEDAGDEPIYEPVPGTQPIWHHVLVTGLFPDTTNIAQIIADMRQLLPNLPHHAIHYLPDQVWERAWMADYHPMKFGQRLCIVPSYYPTEQLPKHHVILDPGLAFGTGTHPTTALCLEWLDANIHGGEILIDYGCGSGILALAALKLGAALVYAIDHDPQALQATLENAKRNEINPAQLRALTPEQLHLKCEADILIANILAIPLQQLAPHFANLVKPLGQLVLSGILSHQVAAVIAVYQDYFAMQQPSERQEWVRITGERKVPPDQL